MKRNLNLSRLENKLISRARIHRRRLLHQSFIDQDLDFDASILSASGARLVIGNRLRSSESVRRDNPAERNLVLLNQITNHRISASLAELTIEVSIAG